MAFVGLAANRMANVARAARAPSVLLAVTAAGRRGIRQRMEEPERNEEPTAADAGVGEAGRGEHEPVREERRSAFAPGGRPEEARPPGEATSPGG